MEYMESLMENLESLMEYLESLMEYLESLKENLESLESLMENLESLMVNLKSLMEYLECLMENLRSLVKKKRKCLRCTQVLDSNARNIFPNIFKQLQVEKIRKGSVLRITIFLSDLSTSFLLSDSIRPGFILTHQFTNSNHTFILYYSISCYS